MITTQILNAELEDTPRYIPGVCNIGTEEVKKREKGGWVSICILTLFMVILQWVEAERAWRLLVFIPSLSAAIFFLQARLKFCASYGIRGFHNFDNTKQKKVVRGRERRKDRQTSFRILLLSFLIASFVTLAYLCVPV